MPGVFQTTPSGTSKLSTVKNWKNLKLKLQKSRGLNISHSDATVVQGFFEDTEKVGAGIDIPVNSGFWEK